jgi:hypothetical protein
MEKARETGPDRGPLAVRIHRQRLLRTAQGLLKERDHAKPDRYQVVYCHRRFPFPTVGVARAGDGSDARITGLHRCGSVWTCPVCAATIAEQRRAELSLAMTRATGAGYVPALLTLTFPHTEADALERTAAQLDAALHRLSNAKGFKGLMRRYGKLGAIRAREVTWGINGWHPHVHDLIIAAPGLAHDPAALRVIKRAWLRACIREGIGPAPGGEPKAGRSRFARLDHFRAFWRHAVTLQDGRYAAEYIAKYGRDGTWSLSSELTKPHAKTGIRRAMWADDLHFTPMQLVEWATNGDATAARAFREFAEVYAGKRALVWTRGLKLFLGIADATDEELAAQADRAPLPAEQRVADITREDYALILSRDALPEFLAYVARDCCDPATAAQDVADYIAMLRDRPKRASGRLSVRVVDNFGELRRHELAEPAALDG